MFLSGKAADLEKEKAERVEKFANWIDILEQKFEAIETEYLNGVTPGAGDFLLFSLINLLCYNEHSKLPEFVEEMKFALGSRDATREFYERME